MTKKSGRRSELLLVIRACPEAVAGGIFSRMRVRQLRSLRSGSFAGAAFAMGVSGGLWPIRSGARQRTPSARTHQLRGDTARPRSAERARSGARVGT